MALEETIDEPAAECFEQQRWNERGETRKLNPIFDFLRELRHQTFRFRGHQCPTALIRINRQSNKPRRTVVTIYRVNLLQLIKSILKHAQLL